MNPFRVRRMVDMRALRWSCNGTDVFVLRRRRAFIRFAPRARMRHTVPPKRDLSHFGILREPILTMWLPTIPLYYADCANIGAQLNALLFRRYGFRIVSSLPRRRLFAQLVRS
jgi:hypothetical protein